MYKMKADDPYIMQIQFSTDLHDLFFNRSSNIRGVIGLLFSVRH